MIDKWMTTNEAAEHFDVTRRTIERWRKKHTIRAAKLSRRHPVMLHFDDLKEADRHALQNDPSRTDVA